MFKDREMQHEHKGEGEMIDTQGMSSELGISGENVILKCDFCEEVCQGADEMMSHLNQCLHYSASSFYSSTDAKPFRLKEELVLTNRVALYQTVMAVCPAKECNIIFQTIYECILHNSQKHDFSSPPTYALTKLSKEIHLDISVMEPKCLLCNVVASSVGELNKHMQQGKNHPCQQLNGFQCYLLCRVCQQFPTSFESAASHSAAEHPCEMEDGILRLSVLYGADKVVHQLPDGSQPNSKRKAVAGTGQVSKKQKAETVSNPDIGDTMYNRTMKDDTDNTLNTAMATEITDPSVNMSAMHSALSTSGNDINEDSGAQRTLDEASSTNTEIESDLIEGYKCDFCNMTSDREAIVVSHMQEELHYSASLVFMDSSHTPVYIKKPCAVTLDTDERTVMATCPVDQCNKSFPSTYVCSEHYSVCHQESSDPAYGVAKVETQETIMFKYMYTAKIYSMSDEALHHVNEESATAFKCYICSICKGIFPTCKHVAKHLKQHRSNENKVIEMIPVTFLRVSKSKVKHALLPFRNDNQGELDCINGKITNLHYLKKYEKDESMKLFSRKIWDLGRRKRQLTSRFDSNENPGVHGTLDEASSTNTEVESDLIEGYKCDYCDIASHNKEVVLSHLKEVFHNSASLVFMDPSHIPVYMKKPCALRVDIDKRAFVVSCPVVQCHQPFKSPYICSEHYSVCHKEYPDLVYGVAEVVSQETLIYEFDKGDFKVSEELLQRVKGERAGALAYKCFICKFCTNISTSHEAVLNHLRQHSSKRNIFLTKLPVTMLWVRTQAAKQHVLPFNNDKIGEQACFRRQISNWESLKATVGTTGQKKELKKKLNQIRKLNKQTRK